MTYFPQPKVTYSDSSNLDAFGRLRVGEPFTLFTSQLQYDEDPGQWETIITGNATMVHDPDSSSVNMNVTTSTGDRVIRQSRQYVRYRPGKSQLILSTGVFGTGTTNCAKRIGYYDDDNGVFFQEINGVISIVIRSSTSGSPLTETVIAQSNWNVDKLDGVGTSGHTIDSTKAQIFVIDLQWLGVGRVRCGFEIGGTVYYAHEFLHANIVDVTYMSTANLPVRYEIENIGPAGTGTSLNQICSTVISEGGSELEGKLFSASNGATAIVAGATVIPILSIRPTLTYKGQTNRTTIVPARFASVNETNTAEMQIIRGGTLSGPTSWSAVSDMSAVEYDVASTGITGGELLFSTYAPASTQNTGSTSAEAISKHLLTVNHAGTDSEVMTVAARAVSGSANVFSAFTWLEYN